MFLRNIARSLSFTTATVKGTRGSKDQQRQRQHTELEPAPETQSRLPSTKHQLLTQAVEVGTGSPRTGFHAVHLTTATAQTLLPPPPPVPLPSAVGAEPVDHHQPSATANPITGFVSDEHNNHVQHHRLEQQQHRHYHHQTLHAASERQSLINSSTIASTSQSPTTLPLPVQDDLNQVSILDFADHDPASNFPLRPLHLQTLSPTTGFNLSLDQTSEQLSPILHDRRTIDLTNSTSNEPGIAMQRKVWVKRPGASATRVEVNEDDLVDNVRDVILRKYANSLGRQIDSPDITLKILSREPVNKTAPAERVLGPEESIGRTLDTYFPGGQTIDEALLIDVPQKRTPKPSPRPGNHHVPYYIPEDYRPGDGAREYFPPMPLHSPHIAHIQHAAAPNGALPAMSVLTTGQVPALPSPSTHGRARHARPKYPRQHTSSPTIIHASQTNGIGRSPDAFFYQQSLTSTDGKTQINGITLPSQPLPTPPPAAVEKSVIAAPNRTTSPHPGKSRKKRQAATSRDLNGELPLPSKPASANLLDGRVPPINVLLVEDNVINLKLLEQFMRRLKVRWQSAMNGREAVNMWRKGGFHLVLMDIQLPVMNGLEATKEIRRLESVNGIGLSVFGNTTADRKTNGNGLPASEDRLKDRALFKSPVIIVALTASSLQSDRHEALAVGCNDFLTKPVNFVWMERKVTEWGCMQALIDFNGWRKWKAIAEQKASEDPEKRKQEEKEEKAKAKAALKAMMSRPPPSTRRESSGDSNSKKDETSNGISSSAASTNATSTDQPPSRRGHKGSRSTSSSLGPTLGTTVEVDERH